MVVVVHVIIVKLIEAMIKCRQSQFVGLYCEEPNGLENQICGESFGGH